MKTLIDRLYDIDSFIKKLESEYTYAHELMSGEAATAASLFGELPSRVREIPEKIANEYLQIAKYIRENPKVLLDHSKVLEQIQKLKDFSKQQIKEYEEKNYNNTSESNTDNIGSLNIGKEETQHTMNATDTVKTQDDADKALETQRQATKENSSRNNEAQEKAVREQVAKNEGQRKPAFSHADLEDMGLARIEAFKEKYDLSMGGRKKYNEAQWEQILDQELGFTDIEDKFRDDFVKGMMDFYWKDPEIRNGVRAEIPKPSIKAQIEAQYKARQQEALEQEKPKPRDPLLGVQRNQDNVRSQLSPEQRDALFYGKNGRPQEPKPEEQPKALDPRTAAQDRARLNEQISQLKPQEQVNTPTQQPDRFAAFREQLQRKEPLQQNENGEKTNIDKSAAFKEGIEKTKQLAQNNQQKMMALFKKKYKDGWSDY